MEVPEHIKKFAKEHGFNSVRPAKRINGKFVYPVAYIDDKGFPLPTGLPHFIIDHNGTLDFVTDVDFHITHSL